MRKTHNPNADVNGIASYIKAGRSFTTTCQVFDIGEKQYEAICQKYGLTRPITRSTKPRKPTTLCEHQHCLRPAVNDGMCKTHTPKLLELPQSGKLPVIKDTPSAVARRVWGSKLTERDGDYFLDNKRIGFNDLMRKTNRSLITWGMEPVSGNPAWDCL